MPYEISTAKTTVQRFYATAHLSLRASCSLFFDKRANEQELFRALKDYMLEN